MLTAGSDGTRVLLIKFAAKTDSVLLRMLIICRLMVTQLWHHSGPERAGLTSFVLALEMLSLIDAIAERAALKALAVATCRMTKAWICKMTQQGAAQARIAGACRINVMVQGMQEIQVINRQQAVQGTLDLAGWLGCCNTRMSSCVSKWAITAVATLPLWLPVGRAASCAGELAMKALAPIVLLIAVAVARRLLASRHLLQYQVVALWTVCAA